jgi:dUTPase
MIELPTYQFALRDDVKDDLRFLPTKGEPNATGYDVKAAPKDRQPIILHPGWYAKIPLGFRAFIPEGWWMELRPRSSSFAKKSMHTLYGVIDQDFSLENLYACQYLPVDMSFHNTLTIEFGESIGQMVPIKRQEMIVESVSNEEIEQLYKKRNAVRNGGFGSTGA